MVHRGRIVHERYLNGMTERTPHLLMSVSKSVCGAVLGIAIGRGLLHADQLVTDIAPEFAGTSLDGATVQHVIDMTAGTDFLEDYGHLRRRPVGIDATDEPPLIDYERHAGYRPLGSRTPIGTLGHFRTYGLERPHGAWFSYRSPLTNIAARIVEIVNDLPYPEVVARDLWAPLGQEHDADIMLDPLGHPVVEGGMSCSLRDLARFALAYLRDGGGVVPSAWVDDTRLGNDAAVAAFAAEPRARRRVGRAGPCTATRSGSSSAARCSAAWASSASTAGSTGAPTPPSPGSRRTRRRCPTTCRPRRTAASPPSPRTWPNITRDAQRLPSRHADHHRVQPRRHADHRR